MKALLPLAAIALALGAVACSGDGDEDITVNVPPDQAQPGLNVEGMGVVTVEPDLAELNLGVEVTEDNADLALVNANGALDNVMQVLEDAGVAEEDIQTTGLSIYPLYDFSGETQEITGYTASNLVDVKIRDLDSVGEIVDGVTNAAGNAVRVNYITFTREDNEEALNQARNLAVEDARQKAEALADSSGVGLGSVQSISENSFVEPPPIPFAEGAAEAADETIISTPISAGTMEVTLSVFIVYNIDQ
jgi:uncharacterized protein YggE